MNGNIKDISGQRFGRLVALEMVGRNKSQSVLWKCVCECGNITVVVGSSLRGGYTTSCGCFHKDKLKVLNTTHGMSKTPLGKVWNSMKQRCYNKKCAVYIRYGGRGIIVCDEWLQNPPSFFNWALENGYNHGLQIDRIDNDGDYCPENCRWVTNTENNRNKRTNRFLTFEGRTQTVVEWAEELGINKFTIGTRLLRGHSVEEALSVNYLTPQESCRKNPISLVTINKETLSIRQWLEKVGINKATYYSRIRGGFTSEQALLTSVDVKKRSRKSKAVA